MPMVIHAINAFPEIRAAIRTDTIDILSAEYHGLREYGRSYEVWHSVGSLARASTLGTLFPKRDSNGFLDILPDEWIAVGAGRYNGQAIARVHLGDLKKGNVPPAGTPYTTFVRLENDSPIIISGQLNYDHFMRDDRILMVAGSPENRESLAKIIFGKNRTTFGSNPFMNVAGFRAEAKGRLLYLGYDYGGLYGYSYMNLDGRFVGVRDRREQLAPRAPSAQKRSLEEAVTEALSSEKPVEDLLREEIASGLALKERIASLESQIQKGRVTLGGKEYQVVSGQEEKIMEAIKAGKEFQTEMYDYSGLKRHPKKTKKDILDFD
ncbi:hypothetical protein HY501_00765 [Candidatus Woesearchaeota archaeon]|nr:hypothetical protein [Candidatus Woesearchaeota archaeon]